MVGDSLPVSVFADHADGQFEQGASAYEKRGSSVMVPEWDETKCIQCNRCSYVCPHAVIRPFVMNDEELKNAPEATKATKMLGKGTEGMHFSIAISPMDCTGCGSCANVCPAPNKALVMKPMLEQMDQQEIFNATAYSVTEKDMGPLTVVSAQFKQPLLEFSGACGAAARLLTQN